MAFDVLHELKTEADVKSAGKYRQEGKNYVVQVQILILHAADCVQLQALLLQTDHILHGPKLGGQLCNTSTSWSSP